MSAYKSILVPVSDARWGAVPLDAAFRLAAAFGSHVAALHVRVDPATAVPLVGEGMSGSMVEEMMSLAERQADERAKAVRVLFDQSCTSHDVRLAVTPPANSPAVGVTAEWIEQTGREEEAVTWRGRLSDLVVIGRPDPDEDLPSLMTLNAALMESGRPILLAPPVLPATIGDNVVIAWNGSAEAGRAVGLALPLLCRATTVTILSITEDDRAAAAPAAELAAYLAWHGITAAVRVVHAIHGHAGAELLKAAGDVGADLLVMGAYTHSRLRQLILGGVTRHVLHHAALPCLLCH